MSIDIEDMKGLGEWFGSRFDKIDARLDAITEDMIERSHEIKGSVGTMSIQIAEIAAQMGELRKTAEKMDAWRAEEGPLDHRFSRMAERMDGFDRWKTGLQYVAGFATLLVTTTFGWIFSGRT